MKKRIVIFISLAVLGISVFLTQATNQDKAVELPHDELVIARGQVCPVYEPRGRVLYNSNWTGELPTIDLVTNEYKTATFALG